MMKSCLLVAEVAGADATAVPDAQVMELRQYKIVPGKRDAFIAMFERLFVESQEQLGMRLIGQFRDGKDANRFVWLRSFPDMATREKALNAFYFGPVWNAHRAEANPMLDDNDNVLLLSPATAELAFGPAGSRAKPDTTTTPRGPLLATIEYLWKEPTEGFITFFCEHMKPAIEAAGLHYSQLMSRSMCRTIFRGCRFAVIVNCSSGSPARVTIRRSPPDLLGFIDPQFGAQQSSRSFSNSKNARHSSCGSNQPRVQLCFSCQSVQSHGLRRTTPWLFQRTIARRHRAMGVSGGIANDVCFGFNNTAVDDTLRNSRTSTFPIRRRARESVLVGSSARVRRR